MVVESLLLAPSRRLRSRDPSQSLPSCFLRVDTRGRPLPLFTELPTTTILGNSEGIERSWGYYAAALSVVSSPYSALLSSALIGSAILGTLSQEVMTAATFS